jgi:YHS domain-containing protein
MKKLSLLALASMALVGVASAQTKTPAKTKAPAKISCAVMKGDMVGVAEATKEGKFADYKGRRYFFCCPHCISEFKKDPSKFKTAPSIPTPKK